MRTTQRRLFNVFRGQPTVLIRTLALITIAVLTACQSSPAQRDKPQDKQSAALPALPKQADLLLWDTTSLAQTRAGIAAADPALLRARAACLRLAKTALTEPIRTVTAGKSEDNPARTAPTGDPRDYVSLSPYWWPDPDKADGLPYIRRDGNINPDRAKYDAHKLGRFGEVVHALATGYYLTGDERFAKRAAEHLRAWFVTEETRMKPNFNFAQFRPGRTKGSPSGLIESLRIRWLPDAAGLLLSSPAWTREDHNKLRAWYGELLDWMLTSPLGKKERKASNNHGSWYASQAIKFAVFANRTEIAQEMIRALPDRIAKQIAKDGSQPEEMKRTRSLGYHDFNLRALLDASVLAQRLGTELHTMQTKNKRSLRLAIDFVRPRMTGEIPWPGKQIVARRIHNQFQMFRIAGRLFGEPAFEAAAQKLRPEEDLHAWMDLLLPPLKNAR